MSFARGAREPGTAARAILAAPRRGAAVDRDDGAGNVGGFVGGEKRGQARHLFRLAETAERNLGQLLRLPFLRPVVGGELERALGLDEARADGVGAHAVGGVVE